MKRHFLCPDVTSCSRLQKEGNGAFRDSFVVTWAWPPSSANLFSICRGSAHLTVIGWRASSGDHMAEACRHMWCKRKEKKKQKKEGKKEKPPVFFLARVPLFLHFFFFFLPHKEFGDLTKFPKKKKRAERPTPPSPPRPLSHLLIGALHHLSPPPPTTTQLDSKPYLLTFFLSVCTLAATAEHSTLLGIVF